MRGFAVASLSLLIVVSVSGCAADRAGAPEMSQTAPAPLAPPVVQQDAVDAAPGAGTVGRFAANDADVKPVSLEEADNARTAAEAFDRKIIRNAEVVLEVDDPGEAQLGVSDIATQFGGFVVTSEMTMSGSSRRVTITMRVPAENFGEAIKALRAAGVKLLHEKVTGQDVTEEYIDLQARIRTKQALEAQFLEIMKQARTVEDALEVQRQIADVRGEIERLEGRRRFLENQSSLSTIKITLNGPTPVVHTSGTSFGDHVRRAFGDAIDTGSAIIIGFIRFVGVMTPVVLLIGVPAFFVLRYLWRRLRRRLAQREVESPAPSFVPRTATPPPSE
jgi:hypothetical protein